MAFENQEIKPGAPALTELHPDQRMETLRDNGQLSLKSEAISYSTIHRGRTNSGTEFSARVQRIQMNAAQGIRNQRCEMVTGHVPLLQETYNYQFYDENDNIKAPTAAAVEITFKKGSIFDRETRVTLTYGEYRRVEKGRVERTTHRRMIVRELQDDRETYQDITTSLEELPEDQMAEITEALDLIHRGLQINANSDILWDFSQQAENDQS